MQAAAIMGDRPISRIGRTSGVEDLVAVLAALGCAACGRIGFGEGAPTAGDAAVGDIAPCDPSARFGAPVPVPIDELATAANDAALRLMPDELSGYFSSDRTTGAAAIYLAQRDDRRAAFAATIALDQASHPALAADGTFVLFERAGDVWIAARSAPARFAAIGVAVELSSGADDGAPFVQATGDDVYFASSRDSGSSGDHDLYHSLRVDSSFVAPERLGELATGFDEGAPVVSADGLALYFRSHRPAELAGDNIYVARRASTGDAWGPAALVEAVNSDAGEEPSWLSVDGCRLYLTSDRSGNADVYLATRGGG